MFLTITDVLNLIINCKYNDKRRNLTLNAGNYHKNQNTIVNRCKEEIPSKITGIVQVSGNKSQNASPLRGSMLKSIDI